MTAITGESFLLGVAQIGLGFAGFSGLIISLRQAPSQSWLPNEAAAMRFILGHCFGMMLLAFFPFLPAFLSWSEPAIWRASNLLMALFLAAQVVIQSVRIRNAIRRESRPRSLMALIGCYMVPTAFLCITLIWASRVGSLSLFACGLVWLLLQSGIQFSVSLSVYMRSVAAVGGGMTSTTVGKGDAPLIPNGSSVERLSDQSA